MADGENSIYYSTYVTADTPPVSIEYLFALWNQIIISALQYTYISQFDIHNYHQLIVHDN